MTLCVPAPPRHPGTRGSIASRRRMPRHSAASRPRSTRLWSGDRSRPQRGIERRSACRSGRRNVLLVRLSGLVSHRRRRTFISNGSGVSRGDRNRNARLARLRELVPLENAIVGIDLADKKQMVVVTDHDSKVLARRTFRCRAWDLGMALDWAGRHSSVDTSASRRRRRACGRS